MFALASSLSVLPATPDVSIPVNNLVETSAFREHLKALASYVDMHSEAVPVFQPSYDAQPEGKIGSEEVEVLAHRIYTEIYEPLWDPDSAMWEGRSVAERALNRAAISPTHFYDLVDRHKTRVETPADFRTALAHLETCTVDGIMAFYRAMIATFDNVEKLHPDETSALYLSAGRARRAFKRAWKEQRHGLPSINDSVRYMVNVEKSGVFPAARVDAFLKKLARNPPETVKEVLKNATAVRILKGWGLVDSSGTMLNFGKMTSGLQGVASYKSEDVLLEFCIALFLRKDGSVPEYDD